MATFAKINSKTNIVVDILHVNDYDCVDSNGIENEEMGIQHLLKHHPKESIGHYWKQTSVNNKIRKNGAALGFTYDSIKDVFISPKPFESWSLDEETCNWKPPVERPNVENKINYVWNEETQSWILNE